MDKSWVDLANRHSNIYYDGIDKFLTFAYNKRNLGSRIYCLCKKCENRYIYMLDQLCGNIFEIIISGRSIGNGRSMARLQILLIWWMEIKMSLLIWRMLQSDLSKKLQEFILQMHMINIIGKTQQNHLWGQISRLRRS